jgi:hypothetical protein
VVRRGRLPYREGDWFAVPLRDGGWAVGRVARMPPPPKRGIDLLGYFFGPIRDCVPVLKDVDSLASKDAVGIKCISDLGLISGRWPVLGGRGPDWAAERDRWPMPAFGFHDEIRGCYFRREYPDDPRQLWLRQVPITAEEYVRLPRDGFAFDGAVEIWLTRLLETR